MASIGTQGVGSAGVARGPGGPVSSGGTFSSGGAERSAGRGSSFSSRNLAHFRPGRTAGVSLSPRIQAPNTEMVSISNAQGVKSRVARTTLISDRNQDTSFFNLNQPVSEMGRGRMVPSERSGTSKSETRIPAFSTERSLNSVRSELAKRVPSNGIETPSAKPRTRLESPAVSRAASRESVSPSERKSHPKSNFERAIHAFAERRAGRVAVKSYSKSTRAERDSDVEPARKFARIIDARRTIRSVDEIKSSIKADNKTFPSVSTETKTTVLPKTRTEIATKVRERIRTVLRTFSNTEKATHTITLPETNVGFQNKVLPVTKMEELLSNGVLAEIMPAVKSASETQTEPLTKSDELVGEELKTDALEQMLEKVKDTKKTKITAVKFEVDTEAAEKRKQVIRRSFRTAAIKVYGYLRKKVSGSEVSSGLYDIKNRNTDSASIKGLRDPDGTAKKWVKAIEQTEEMDENQAENLMNKLYAELPPLRMVAQASSRTADVSQIKAVHEKPDPFDANYGHEVVKVSVLGSSDKSPQLVIAEKEAA